MKKAVMLAAAFFFLLSPGVASDSLLGEQKIVVILVSFPGAPLLGTVTPEMYRSTYFGPGRCVDGFLRECSYGKTWATGQVLGPFVLDADYFNQPLATRDAAVRAASAQADLSGYNRLVLVVPQSSTGLLSGGLGSIGAETIPLYPSGSMTASTTWLGDASAGSDSERLNCACHELGHNLGLAHSRASDFGEEALGPVGQLPAPWDQLRDYGDSFSNLGRGSGHWPAPHKAALGWLAEGAGFQTVETGGTYVLQPYEFIGDALKALRVRRGTDHEAWLWLEYRHPTVPSYDDGLPGSAAGGMLVHYEDALWSDPYRHSDLLRFHPDTPREVYFGNAPLAAGEAWADPYSNLSLTVGGDLSGGLSVTVAYTPPGVLSFSPVNSAVGTAGGSVTVDVSAPEGFAWTVTPSVPWIGIASGGSGTGNGKVTLTVSPASLTAARWGRITAGDAFAVVTQEGLAGNVALDAESAEFPAEGGTGQIGVFTNAPDYSWDYSCSETWVQSVIFSRLSTTGPGTLRYVVSQNTGAAPRTGTIHIGGKTFTVNQAGGGPQVDQFTWERMPLDDAPMSRIGMDMAVFPPLGESVLYGGGASGTVFTDTWIWDGADWTARDTAHRPGRLSGHAMSYEAPRNRVLLYGGFDPDSPDGVTDRTWAWDGTDWAQLHPATSPLERAQHSMVYNPVSQTILLFGGREDLNDTWEWDGTNWTDRSAAGSPPPRERAAMAYDPARNEILLFGGARDLYSGQCPVVYGDTWVWDGARWQQKNPLSSPSPRLGARMAYSPELGQVVLVGGCGIKDLSLVPPYPYVFDYREETWVWDGSDWTQRFPNQSPEFSYTYGLVYDPVHHALFAHLGDGLHCADRGPQTYALRTGTGAVLLSAYRCELACLGGTRSFDVQATVPWTAASESDWIALEGEPSGSGDGTVSFRIAGNTSAEPRRGRVRVNDKVFTVQQYEGLAEQDYERLAACLSGSGAGSPAFTAAWDLNGDGRVDLLDMILLLRWLSLPAGAPGRGSPMLRDGPA